MKSRCNRLLSTLLTVIFAGLLAVTVCAQRATPMAPQSAGPLTVTDLMMMMRRQVGRDMTQADLATRIDRVGLDFYPTPEIITRLRSQGAYPHLLNSVRRAGEKFNASAIAPATISNSSVTVADPVIEEVRRNVRDYIENMPDFICHQEITRYLDREGTGGWTKMDLLTYEVTYNGKHESYKPLRINGFETKIGLERVGGATSTGDFASRLAELFKAESSAKFKPAGKDRLGSRQTLVYDFSVSQPNSKLTIKFGELPAVVAGYSGSVWIDAETKQVLRIELAVEDLPASYAGIQAENIIDYDLVKLQGIEEKLLLPTRAEVVLSDRKLRQYSRNVNYFKLYRKFETDIKVVDEPAPDKPEKPQ